MSHDNEMTPIWLMPLYLSCSDYLKALGVVPDSNRVGLTTEDAQGHREQIVVEAKPDKLSMSDLQTLLQAPGAPPVPLYLTNVTDPYWFEPLPDHNAVYFQFNQVQEKPGESLQSFAKRLQEYLEQHAVKNLIIDVRRNPGGNSTLEVPLWRTLIHFEMSRPDARIFVIMGRNTFSACQVFIGNVERLTHAVFVGEPSSSSPTFVGETSWVIPPYSNAQISISTRIHQVYDNVDQRRWIAPSIPVVFSSKDYFSNRDPALDAVFRVIGAGLEMAEP
jgi:hypothetical protein